MVHRHHNGIKSTRRINQCIKITDDNAPIHVEITDRRTGEILRSIDCKGLLTSMSINDDVSVDDIGYATPEEHAKMCASIVDLIRELCSRDETIAAMVTTYSYMMDVEYLWFKHNERLSDRYEIETGHSLD